IDGARSENFHFCYETSGHSEQGGLRRAKPPRWFPLIFELLPKEAVEAVFGNRSRAGSCPHGTFRNHVILESRLTGPPARSKLGPIAREGVPMQRRRLLFIGIAALVMGSIFSSVVYQSLQKRMTPATTGVYVV